MIMFTKQGTIEQFAAAYNLTLEVNYYEQTVTAHFADCIYISGPEYPIYTVGRGETREEALADYAEKISCNVLVFDDERSLLVWKLI